MMETQKLNIEISGFLEALKAGIDMNLITVLFSIKVGSYSTIISEIPMRGAAYTEALVRKGLVVIKDSEPFLTDLGTQILDKILNPGEVSIKQTLKTEKKSKSDDFELFWKAFPATDAFEYKGLKFNLTRPLRINKAGTREQFDKIVAEGEFTVQDLIAAINLQVLSKKEESVKERTNKMKFINNSVTWLRQRIFESYLVEIRKNEESEGIPLGAVDI